MTLVMRQQPYYCWTIRNEQSFTKEQEQPLLWKALCIKESLSLLARVVHIIRQYSKCWNTPVNKRSQSWSLFPSVTEMGLYGPIKVNSKYKRKRCWRHPKFSVEKDVRKRCKGALFTLNAGMWNLFNYNKNTRPNCHYCQSWCQLEMKAM